MSNPSAELAKLKASLPKASELKLTETGDERKYVAFKPVDRAQRRCEFCPVDRASERVTYGYLHRIVENRPFYTQLALVYQFIVIVIEGKNLHAIADAIDREVCEAVWAFDERFWEAPAADSQEPFVKNIVVHVEKPQGLQALEEMDNYRVKEPSTH